MKGLIVKALCFCVAIVFCSSNWFAQLDYTKEQTIGVITRKGYLFFYQESAPGFAFGAINPFIWAVDVVFWYVIIRMIVCAMIEVYDNESRPKKDDRKDTCE